MGPAAEIPESNGAVQRRLASLRCEFRACRELDGKLEDINRWAGAAADEFNAFRPPQARKENPRRTSSNRALQKKDTDPAAEASR